VLRSILAVLAGIVTLIIVSFGIEAVVPANENFAYIYGTLSVVLGGWVTARLAPREPLKHAIAMGALQALLTLLLLFSPDHKVSTAQCVVIALASFVAAVAGGALFTAKKGSVV
jgi:predicted MFS family arabinose efflux permease